MLHEFKGYLIPRNKLPFWDKLTIDAHFVTFQRNRILGMDETLIPISSISSIRLNSGILFCSITIHFYGNEIVAEGFLNSDGKKILELLGF